MLIEFNDFDNMNEARVTKKPKNNYSKNLIEMCYDSLKHTERKVKDLDELYDKCYAFFINHGYEAALKDTRRVDNEVFQKIYLVLSKTDGTTFNVSDVTKLQQLEQEFLKPLNVGLYFEYMGNPYYSKNQNQTDLNKYRPSDAFKFVCITYAVVIV
jgi:hypothetical protein